MTEACQGLTDHVGEIDAAVSTERTRPEGKSVECGRRPPACCVRLAAVLVRERRDSDAAALIEIAARVHALDGYPPYLPDDDYSVLLFGHETMSAWVAEIDGRPVGQVTLHPRT